MDKKIFNIDFNKSGSSSLTKAMEILGFKSLHYKKGNFRLYDIMVQNKKNQRDLLYEMEEYQFFSDFGGSNFYKELDKQYPHSKFILTLRNLNDWINSREKHVKRNQLKSGYKYDFLVIDKAKWAKKREKLMKEYLQYFEERPNDFLIIDICNGEGWEKLCSFLSRSFPKEEFPHLNKSFDQEKKIKK
ncbi:MAG: sulfotransferase family protein [Nanoarchaeota archaeon]|nr:sulfotransferase family protein [Nanoarchaeota archaeon]